MEYIETMPVENSKRIHRVCYIFMFAVFLYGLFLPDNWKENFGILSVPIFWARQHVPIIYNVIEIGANPEFISGFMGLVIYIPFICNVFFIWYGFVDRTDPENIRIVIGKDPIDISLGYLFGAMAFGIIFVVGCYIFPINTIISQKNMTLSDNFFILVVKNRFLISLVSSLIVGAISWIIFFITVCLMCIYHKLLS